MWHTVQFLYDSLDNISKLCWASPWESQTSHLFWNTVAEGNGTQFHCSIWFLCPRLKFVLCPLTNLITNKKLAMNKKSWLRWINYQLSQIQDIQVPLGTHLFGGLMDQNLYILLSFTKWCVVQFMYYRIRFSKMCPMSVCESQSSHHFPKTLVGGNITQFHCWVWFYAPISNFLGVPKWK